MTAPPPGRTQPAPQPDRPPTVVPDPPFAGEPPASVSPAPASSPRLVGAWLVLMVLGVLVVLVGLSPAVEQRDQRALLASYRTEIESASNEAYGLPGIQAATEAPTPGSPVGVLDAERTGLHSVTVEGTDPADTRQGPGHVVGTAGPGQPGNSAVLARRQLYGAPFGSLGDMVDGDKILVTTVQGPTVYTVRYVGRRTITDATPPSAAGAAATPTTSAVPAAGDAAKDAAAAPAPLLPDGPLTPAQLYGPTEDDRLTLVTSDSPNPWGTGDAVVVVARLDGQPFPPTPQGGRTAQGDGRHGDPGIFAPLLLAGLLALASVMTAVWLHRNLPWRSAYLLSAPLLLAATILIAEQLAATMPAWT